MSTKFIVFLQDIAWKRGWALVLHITLVILISWIPAQAICLAFHFTFPGPTEEDFFKSPLVGVTAALLVAPLLETQVMRMIFFAFGKMIQNNLALCATSAAIWGILHLSSESWGLHAAWAFFVMGICFRRLQESSTQRAVNITMLIHAGFNSLTYGVYLLLPAMR